MSKTKNAQFSGWKVLVACFIIMFFMQGGLQCFSLYMASWISDTGFPLAQMSLVSTFATIFAFIANLLVSPLLKRIGVKGTLLLGVLFHVIHWILYSNSHSILSFYIAGSLGGFAIGFGTIAPCSVVMNNWFVKNRSTYMSIVIAGSMFGGAVFQPICGALISSMGWRSSYYVMTAIVAIPVIIAVLLLLIDSPARKGQKAYGEEDAKGQAAQAVTNGVDAAVARKSVSFWLLMAAIFLIGCSTNIENFLPAFWQSRGLSVVASSTNMGIYNLLAAVAAITLGRVNDKLGGKAYIVMTCGLFAIGTLGILFVGANTLPFMVIAMIPFAVGAKKTSSLTPPLVVAESFGRKDYALLIGGFTAMLQLGIAGSNPLIGSLYDMTGDYSTPFIVFASINLVALVLVFAALVLSPYRKVKLAGSDV